MGDRASLSALALPADAVAPLQAITKQQVDTAAATFIPLAQKGATNGVCELTGSVVPRSRVQQASTTLDGTIVLAGDLGGTATAPTVPNLVLKQNILGAVAAKTASYTLVSADDVVVFDTSSGPLTATLPTATVRAGKRYLIKKLGGTTANPLTIATTSSQTIDGSTTEVISVAGGFREVISDGANWHVIGGKVEPVIVALANVGAGSSISIDASAGSIYRVTTTGATATLAVPTNPIDGDSIFVDLTASAALALTINASIVLTAGIASPINVAAGKKLFLNLRTIGTTWYLLAAAAQS